LPNKTLHRLTYYILRIGDLRIASFYGFSWNRTTYYYLGGFLSAFAKYNPGTVIVGHAIRQAITGKAYRICFFAWRRTLQESVGGSII
jgi:hypothetical protein